MSKQAKGELRHRGEKKDGIVADEPGCKQGKDPSDELVDGGKGAGFWLLFAGLSLLGGAVLTFLILWFLGDVNPSQLYGEVIQLFGPKEPPHPVYQMEPNKWLADQRSKGEILFTTETLEPFNASKAKTDRKIVLCVLGSCFDVTAGRDFYEEGNDYNCFAGRDGSRSFVTGDFSKEGCRDEVLDLTVEQLLAVEHWRKFYHKHAVYEYIGKLVGRYYDAAGNPTEALVEVEKRIKEEQEADIERKKLPDCNVRFKPEAGAEVWCSTNSGGVARDWAGLPRMIYESSGRRKCVCAKEEEAKSGNPAYIKYKNCSLDAERGEVCHQKKAKISAHD